MSYTYAYPRAALTVDCVVFGRAEAGLQLLLIQRAAPPFEGCWALPGGFVELDETLVQAACRELHEETGIHLASMQQLRVFDAPQRDPRERVISVAHMAVVDVAAHTAQGSDDAREARWFALEALPELAFDHAEIIRAARATLPSD